MDYKIVYLEDLEPDSIQREIENQRIEVSSFNQDSNFETTLNHIKDIGADLLLMDFRLNAGVGKIQCSSICSIF